MNRSTVWRLMGVLLLGLLPMVSGCQPIQAPAETARIPVADILRDPYSGDLPVLVDAALPIDSAEELSGYTNPQALVSTEWLSAYLDNSNLRLVDVRRPTGAADYAVAHIPGAQHVDLTWDLMMDDDPHRIALDLTGPEQFAELMSRLGIANDSTVVVYDSDGGTAAATLWWALRYYGHEDVRMVNGGLVKWMLEGRALTDAVPSFEPTQYTVTMHPQYLARAEDVMQAIADPAVFIVDAALARLLHRRNLSRLDSERGPCAYCPEPLCPLATASGIQDDLARRPAFNHYRNDGHHAGTSRNHLLRQWTTGRVRCVPALSHGL